MGPNNTTVLFAEFPDFSGLSADLSSKDFNALLKEFYQLTDSIVRLHQGILSSFSGEMFVSVFTKQNQTIIPELLALEAVNELRESLKLFFTEKQTLHNIGFKAGIACGIVIIGDIGTDEKKQITVMGEAIIRATRLSEFAEKEQVLVGENIFKIAEQHYHFQKLEPLPIRGKKETLQVYELLGKKQTHLRTESFSQRKITSDMVGRSREMEQLYVLIKQLVAGKGSVVNIVGKAGIGKSRLMAEMKVQPIMEKVLLLEGRALSTGQNLSFHPIAHLIKSWAGISEEDTPASSSEKLHNGIMRIAPAQADDIYAFLATMMSLPLTGKYQERVKGIEGEALEKLILKNLRDLIINATKDKPRIYIIEDMHWSDASSIAMFESLYKLSLHHPVMFINVLRPGYKETGDYILKYLVDNLPDNHITINVSPLDEPESKQLIRNLIQNIKLPVEVNETIIRKTQGNPFFIEEVIRSFLDEGIIEITNNDFRFTEKIHTVNIPETINEVILSRVDKLDEKTKELLKTASVIGRNFYYKVLEEATDTIGELDERLEYLKDAQLISESKKKDEIEYLFKHALAQQATYESILQQSRKDLHLKIARSIEKVFAEKLPEFYGVLAMHYGKAEVPEKIEEYLIKAGEQSLAAGASSEAINYFKHALAVYNEQNKANINKQKAADIEEKIGIAYAMKGLNLEAVDYFDRVLDFYNFHIPKNRTLRILGSAFYFFSFIILIRNQWLFLNRKAPYNIETVYRMLLHKGEALTTVNPKRLFIESQFVVKLFMKYGIGNSDYVLGILSEYSVFFSWMGLFFRTAQKTIEVAHKTGVSKDSVFWLQYRVGCKVYEFLAGNWQEDSEQEYLYNLGLQKGAVWELSVCIAFDGFKLAERGCFTESMSIASRLFNLYDYFENSHARAQGYRLKSLNHLKISKFEEVIKICGEGIEYTGKTNHLAVLQVMYCHRCIAYCMSHDVNKALNDLLESEKLVQQTKMVKLYFCEYLLANCCYKFALLKDKPDRNKTDVHPLLKQVRLLINNSKNVPSHRIQGYRLAAIAYWMKNKQWRAYRCFEKSLSLAENLEAKPELARTCFELGKCLMDTRSKRKTLGSKNGSEYLLIAKRLFEEMDLQWDLEEYKKFIKTNNLIK